MESMSTREYIEFSLKHRNEAQVTDLTGTDCDVFISLTPFFSSETFSIFRVVLNLSSETLDLAFIVLETLAEMLFHLFYLGFSREQIKKIFYFEHTSRFVSDGF